MSDDWNDLAEVDPLWAILSDDTKRNGGWDLADFLASGQSEIDGVLAHARVLGHPKKLIQALDFGCGVGRATRALSAHFESCLGVDVSASMVSRAAELNRDVPNVDFVVNETDDLRIVGDRTFDLVYSSLVLQHVPERRLIERYLTEFARVLSPEGLLVVQLPAHVPIRYRLQPRRRLYHLLRALHVPVPLLQRRLGLHPISMTAVPERDVLARLGQLGLRIIDVERSTISGFGIDSRTYWATRA